MPTGCSGRFTRRASTTKSPREYYARIVKDYPLSPLAGDAKDKLVKFGSPVPPADPAAVARMQKEQNTERPGMIKRSMSVLKTGPDVSTAARNWSANHDSGQRIRRRNDLASDCSPTPNVACGSLQYWKTGDGANGDSGQPRSSACSGHQQLAATRRDSRDATQRNLRRLRRAIPVPRSRHLKHPGATCRYEPGIDQQKEKGLRKLIPF